MTVLPNKRYIEHHNGPHKVTEKENQETPEKEKKT